MIENIFMIVDKMIDEKIERYMRDHRETIMMDINANLNGKTINSSVFRDEIVNQIMRQR